MTAHRLPKSSHRWLATGGAVVLAGVVGVALMLQIGGSACASPPSTGTSSGKATFYDLGSGGTGNCSFAKSPADGLFVALGPSQYSGAGACGSYLSVTGPKGTVRVKVTDQCPECEPGHLDLSRTAFKKIANEVDGIVPIKYHRVANPSVPGPLSFRVKEGSSQYWLAVLADNHGNPLSSMQIAGPNGSFKSASRKDFNYWVIDGGAGPGPFKVKVTDVTGRTVTASGIKLSPGQVQSSGTTTSTSRSTGSTTKKATPKATAAKKKPAPATSRAATPAASAGSAGTPSSAPAVEATTVRQAPVELAAAPVAQQKAC